MALKQTILKVKTNYLFYFLTILFFNLNTYSKSNSFEYFNNKLTLKVNLKNPIKITTPIILKSNNLEICYDDDLKIKFIADIEGAGWKYQLQKKNKASISWDNVVGNSGDVIDNTEQTLIIKSIKNTDPNRV